MTVPSLILNRWFQIGLLCALLLGAWERGNHYRDSRDMWRSATEKQELAYTAAQGAARLAQEALNAKIEQAYQEAKDNADQQAEALSADYQRRLADYVSRMRAEGDGREAGRTIPSAEDQAAGGFEKADAQAELVGVSEYDLGLMVQAVADIEIARAWAAQLIKDGKAE